MRKTVVFDVYGMFSGAQYKAVATVFRDEEGYSIVALQCMGFPLTEHNEQSIEEYAIAMAIEEGL